MKKTLVFYLENKVVIVFLLVIIFIIPPIAIAVGLIPRTPVTNFLTLMSCTVACIIIMCIERWKLEFFNLKGIKRMWMEYCTFTLIGVATLFLFKDLLNLQYNIHIISSKKFLTFWPVLCLMQVLSYKVFLFIKLKSLFDSQKNLKTKLIFANAAIYAVMHVMFGIKFTLVCFIGGIAFAEIYWQYRNSILMLASHMVLNFTAALLGYFQVAT